MGHALDRVMGQLLTVLVLEVLFVVLLLQADGPWYDQRWGVLVAFCLGGLGAPLTLLVPFLLAQDNTVAPVVLLLAAPVANLVLRFLGHYVRLDRPRPS